jgi:hypothetical protein
MSNYASEPLVPVPAAYTKDVSYNYSTNHDSPSSYIDKENKRDTLQSTEYEVDNLKNNEQEKNSTGTGRAWDRALRMLNNSRFYIRILAVLIMIVSLALILSAVIHFAKAKRAPGHPLNQVPQQAPITDQPCIVFSGIAFMNLFLSVAILVISCASSKFKKSKNAITAVYTIISAIGFSSSMGACFFLNKQSTLENDLWKWSCGNHAKGIKSNALDFNTTCHVVGYAWKFGLVQAALELLTFIISISMFVWIKYVYFARYGRVGKIF